MANQDIKSIHSSWREEKSLAYLYGCLAEAEKGTSRESLFRKLAAAAEAQAKFWAQELVRAGSALPQYRASFRTLLVSKLIIYLGPQALLPILAAMKVRGLSVYQGDMPGHPPVTGGDTKATEHHHRVLGTSGALRAAVFGINDGLVSNMSLILGVVGASSNASFVILSGIAGLGAGAFSMAAGEYISMRSQRELFEYQIALEKAEFEQYPEEEIQELSMIYQARGLDKTDADIFARKLLSNEEHAIDILAREELGLNPNELGSPWSAAISSFFSFVIGALVPLLPFLFHAGEFSISISIALTGLALFGVGSVLSLYTGRNALLSGFRMLMIGAFAGLATFGIGRMVGVHI